MKTKHKVVVVRTLVHGASLSQMYQSVHVWKVFFPPDIIKVLNWVELNEGFLQQPQMSTWLMSIHRHEVIHNYN